MALGDPLLWGATPSTERAADQEEVATAPVADPAIRGELEAFLARFGDALEQRDPANLAVDFLGGTTGGFLNAWAPLIADRQQLRGLSVASIDLNQLRTTPVRAAGTVRLVVTYQDSDGRPRQLTATIRAEFNWTEGSWRLNRFEEVTRTGA